MKKKNIYNVLIRLFDFTIKNNHRRIVREWLIDDRNTEEKEQALIRIWNNISSEKDITTVDSFAKTWNKISALEQIQYRKLFINRFIRYAVVLLLPIISGVVVWNISNREYKVPEMIECFAHNGEKKNIVLSDGSRIILNSGSLLVYPEEFSSSNRQVFLYGEANFDIKEDLGRPFIVNAGVLDIEVLGTKFNVESYPDSKYISTTLEEGSVKVYEDISPSKAIILNPNEQLIYLSDENRFIKKTVDATDYTAWTVGELRFISKSLVEVLIMLERRYEVKFFVDTEIQGSDLFTMRFKPHETVEDALFVLGEIIGNINYKREGQTIRLKLESKEVPQ